MNGTAASNVIAFQRVLGFAEGTDREPDPYRVCYGFAHTIRDFSMHPGLSGEWSGGRITRGMYAGRRSTAAGRYQINVPTWRDVQRALRLPDFSPASQDKAAVWLIERDGALEAVRAGDFPTAIARCARTWASLPGSTAGQGTRRYADLEAVYTTAGGTFA